MQCVLHIQNLECYRDGAWNGVGTPLGPDWNMLDRIWELNIGEMHVCLT